ncbi:MAG: hypothetical protein VXZ35_11005, partial [Pseudomonadota bacterium]|nr:hypothetical protein [Pseudomonadota bacterium]
AKADAHEKEGVAEANVIKAKGNAEADALLGTGKAQADVTSAQGDAEAKAARELGLANAEVTREQFKAEADGLVDKFEAMNSMSENARSHEEYRMGLETALKEALASIEAGKDIARENAEVLSVALEKAKIDIVGGEDHFFDNFAKSLSIGKAVDGLADKSGTIQALLNRVIQGKPENATEVDNI